MFAHRCPYRPHPLRRPREPRRVRGAVRADASHRQTLRAAIVTGHDSQLAARYSELRTDEQTRTMVFDDLAGACMWLDVDLEAVRRTITALREELLARSG